MALNCFEGKQLTLCSKFLCMVFLFSFTFNMSAEDQEQKTTDTLKNENVQKVDNSSADNDNDSQISWTTYLFMQKLKGDSVAAGQAAKIDLSFGDLLDSLDIGGTSWIHVRKKRMFFISDFSYSLLSADPEGDATVTRPIGGIQASVGLDAEIEIEVEQIIAMLVMGYYVIEKDLGARENSNINKMLRFGPYAGFRYNYVSVETDIDAEISTSLIGPRGRSRGSTTKISEHVEDSRHWFDPIIGVHGTADFTDKLSGMIAADIGGGITGSDFTWSVTSVLGYHFTEKFSMFGGYRVLDIDYEDGSFALDARYEGPMVGIQFRF